MKKALIIAAVTISAAVIAVLSVMNGTLNWDGSAYVPVTILVFDDDRRPIAGASVSLILPRDEVYFGMITDEEYRDLLLNDRRYVETDEFGSGTIGGRFPAGGTAGVFKRRGSFTVVGDVSIVHPRFSNFRASLRNLLQATEFSIDQSELELVVFLDANRAEQGADDQLPARMESKAE